MSPPDFQGSFGRLCAFREALMLVVNVPDSNGWIGFQLFS